MRARSFGVFWLLFWMTWAHACSGLLVSSLGMWVPDLGLLLWLGLGRRLNSNDRLLTTTAACLGRLSVGIDPPFAVFACYGALAALDSLALSFVDRDRLILRIVCAGAYAALASTWYALVNQIRSGGHALELQSSPKVILASFCIHALLSLSLAPLLARLPGLTLLLNRDSGMGMERSQADSMAALGMGAAAMGRRSR